MLPQIGSTELLVIAMLALIVIGPKDLPVMLRKLGQWVGRLRGMANEFRSSFDEMARQSELDDLRKEVAAMRDAAAAEQASLTSEMQKVNHTVLDPSHTTPEADPDYNPDAAADGQAAPAGEPVHHTIHDHFQTSPMADPDYDPESYLNYGESTAEKVINRRRKVAEAEGAKAPRKPKKAKPAARKAKT